MIRTQTLMMDVITVSSSSSGIAWAIIPVLRTVEMPIL